MANSIPVGLSQCHNLLLRKFGNAGHTCRLKTISEHRLSDSQNAFALKLLGTPFNLCPFFRENRILSAIVLHWLSDFLNLGRITKVILSIS